MNIILPYISVVISNMSSLIYNKTKHYIDLMYIIAFHEQCLP